jgi:hypothetical protein
LLFGTNLGVVHMIDTKSFPRVFVLLALVSSVLAGCKSNPYAPSMELNHARVEFKEALSGKVAETTIVGVYEGMVAIQLTP